MTALSWFLVGLVSGAVAGVAVSWRWWWRSIRRAAAQVLPVDVPHLVDLLRRAHGADVACAVVADEAVVAKGSPAPAGTFVERVISAARLARASGREQVLREGQVVVAVGDGHIGAAIGLAPGQEATEIVKVVSDDLGRAVSELSVSLQREWGSLRDPGAIPDWVATGSESLEGMTASLCEAIRIQTGRPVAVALRDSAVGACMVLGVSRGSDRRLLGLPVGMDSAVGRACAGGIPVIGTNSAELFGKARAERRRKRQEEGTAFPLRDGDEGVGTIVVFGPALDPAVQEWVMWLAVDAGPRLANAARVRTAEMRAGTDELTLLPNRRVLDRAVGSWQEGPAALLLVDLDHFKRVNDTHGHAAGDAVLRHVARAFKRALREEDIAARIGGEEFALWLPHTPLAEATDVAERVRAAVAGTPVHWNGVDLQLTCSIGVSSMPDIVTQARNLPASADAALYQAKTRGRDQVQIAARGS